MKQRFWIFIAAAILLLIIVLGVSLSGGGRKSAESLPSANPAILSCTIESNVGLNTILITNQDTNQKRTVTPTDLPFTFNFNKGDTLSFNVTMIAGYKWNAWDIDNSTFDDHNPLIRKAESSFTMIANFLQG